jgi:WD40 repeat protein
MVVIWDAESSRELAAWRAHEGDVWSVAFTNDGKTLVSGGGDQEKPGEIKLWDTSSWRQRGSLKHRREILCLALAPRDGALAAGTGDHTIKLWSSSFLSK